MTTNKGNTMTTAIKFINSVSTQMVIDTDKPAGQGYIADVWYDNDAPYPCWNINNGTVYLWGFVTREEAVAAIIAKKEVA